MEIEEFIKKLKSAKKSEKYSNNFRVVVVKYYPNKDNIQDSDLPVTKWKLEKKEGEICKYCKTDLSKDQNLYIEFYNPVTNLTIFECGMLFSLFRLNRIVADYAGYHNSQAGKEFIQNIKSIQ